VRTRHTNAREIAAAFVRSHILYSTVYRTQPKFFGAEVSVGSNYGNAASLT